MLKPAIHSLDRILPVIDLKRGQVVHAVAGKREQYQPLQSNLVDSFHPGRVAKALTERVGANDVYVADLDAISGQQPRDWNSYALIENVGVHMWVDAAINSVDQYSRVDSKFASLKRVVVALESLESLRDLEAIVRIADVEKLTFSLDLRDGLPITRDPAVGRMSAESIASYAIGEGVRSIIVLDLAGVGSLSGGDAMIDLCRNIRSRHLEIELVSGGGVRSINDVNRFVEAGCNRVLVATALHTGGIL